MIGVLWRAVALVGVTVPWSLAGAVAVPLSGGSLVTPMARGWARQLLALCGVKVEAFGPPEPLTDPAYLMMSNHSSHFDVPSIYATTPIHALPVAKKELGAIPFFGWALHMGAAILIDRKNADRARASIDKAVATIRAGRSVLMFPEGTRTPTETIGDLKKGAFHLALAARVPVLPVAVLGTRKVLRSGDWKIRPGRVQVRYGRPIPTAEFPEGEEGRERLMQAFRAAIESMVAEGGQTVRNGEA